MAGWTCTDFPCEDDIEGFMRRIHVPEGYVLEHAGQFPGQPLQITYGPDGRLYADTLPLARLADYLDELATFLGQEIETYSAIVKAANIKAE
jgi:hypothetical protein